MAILYAYKAHRHKTLSIINFALDVVLGTKQINKICATDVTSHQYMAILYADKAHRHKTLCFIKLSHAKCASEEKRLFV